MKYLLTIFLFMSVNVFADFDITTLECDLEETKHPEFFSPKLSLRIDEKRKMMRLNLLPEKFYKGLGKYSMYVISESVQHSIGLFIDNLFLSYKTARVGTEEWRMAFYDCKII